MSEITWRALILGLVFSADLAMLIHLACIEVRGLRTASAARKQSELMPA